MRRGTVDVVVVSGELVGLSVDAFIARFRLTAYGRRSAIVAVGAGENLALMSDATLSARADARSVTTTVAHLLAAIPALEVIDTQAPLPGAGRVLIVEDDKINQSLLSTMLSRRGFTIFVANNGETAVGMASRGICDAILMDIQMPGIDGFEATRRIRAMGGRMATIPIIALTALAGNVIEKRCTDVGMTASLLKPVNFDRLAGLLYKWIEDSLVSADVTQGRDDADTADNPGEAAPRADGSVDVSDVFLECMVVELGLDRTRACVQEFLADTTRRCSNLVELLPGWESETIIRISRDIGARASEFGAVGLADAFDELVDRTMGGHRDDAARVVRGIEGMVGRTAVAMNAALAKFARDHRGDSSAAAA